MRMKKFINDSKQLVPELLEGFTLAFPRHVKLSGTSTIVRATLTADLVAPLANMLFAALKVAHEPSEQDQGDASRTNGDRVCSSVDAGPGPRAYG